MKEKKETISKESINSKESLILFDIYTTKILISVNENNSTVEQYGKVFNLLIDFSKDFLNLKK